MEWASAPRGTVEGLPQSAREAGLEIADGFFATQDPELGFEIYASLLTTAKERAIMAGIAAETADGSITSLRAAKLADTSG